MFESKDDEVALPDLSNEEIDGATNSEQDILTNSKATEAATEAAAPIDSVAAPEVAPAAKK